MKRKAKGLWGWWCCCVVGMACMRGEADSLGRVLDGRPDAYDDDSGIAPVAGGLDGNAKNPLVAQPGTFGPVANDNVVEFAAISAFTSPIDASNGATAVYVLDQAATCGEWQALGKGNAPLLVQVLLPRSAPVGTYRVVVADPSAAALAPKDGEATLSLVANGAPLASGAQGSLQVTVSSAGTLHVENVRVSFAGGQTLSIDEFDAVPCVPVTGTGGFAVASALYRAPTAATANVAARPPLVLLSDRPMTCAMGGDATAAPPADGNVLFLTLPSAEPGTYALINTNGPSGVVGGSKAALRWVQPALVTLATAGSAQVVSSGGAVAGTVSASFNDNGQLAATSFAATACP
jgi:hypothetical protein